MAKIKVLLSIDENDLLILDGRAEAAKLDRSAYVVSLLSPSGRPMVYYNEDNYEVCKKVFKLENPQHMVNYALAVLAKQGYEKLPKESQEAPYDDVVIERD